MTGSGTPVFAVAQFRSGSTLLWNLLRSFRDITAYIEPCNDNLIEHIEGGTPPMKSHVGVNSYWDEYLPILPELKRLHRAEFGVNRLWLEAGEPHPELKAYLDLLIRSAAPRAAAMKFTRCLFRVPWLRHEYPQAKILHLHRDPRKQWQSMVRNVPSARRADPDLNTDYDLVTWAVSLAPQLPFLLGPHIRHGYERHYLLWKMSYWMGSRLADLSLDLERDFGVDPRRGINKLRDLLGDSASAEELSGKVHSLNRGDDQEGMGVDWAAMELRSDELLGRLGLEEGIGRTTLDQIIMRHRSEWAPYFQGALSVAARLGANEISRMRSRYLQVSGRLREAGDVLQSLEPKNRHQEPAKKSFWRRPR